MTSKQTQKSKTGKQKAAFPKNILILAIIIIAVAAAYAVFSMGKTGNAKSLLEDGRKLYGEQKYESAAKKLYEYTKIDENNKEAWDLLIKSLLEIQKPDELYYVLEKYQQKFPGDYKINIDMARFYLKTGQNEKAKEQLKAAWEKNKKDPTAQMLLGLIYVDEQNSKEAYNSFRRVLEFESDKNEETQKSVAVAYGFLLEIIGNTGEMTAANLSIIQNAIKFFSEKERGRAHVALGIYYYKNEKWDQALKEFQTALKLSPDKEAWANLPIAEIYTRKRETANAYKHYEAFLKIYSDPKKLTKEDLAGASIYKGINMNDLDVAGVKQKMNELER